ncbi:hypothetical protein FJZ36_15170 [Candidatus Poribacteria bacterium]|nr:hypothetical protein [Candidatus Poribacteria bacterium]
MKPERSDDTAPDEWLAREIDALSRRTQAVLDPITQELDRLRAAPSLPATIRCEIAQRNATLAVLCGIQEQIGAVGMAITTAIVDLTARLEAATQDAFGDEDGDAGEVGDEPSPAA